MTTDPHDPSGTGPAGDAQPTVPLPTAGTTPAAGPVPAAAAAPTAAGRPAPGPGAYPGAVPPHGPPPPAGPRPPQQTGAPVRPPLTELRTPLGWVIAAVILFWPTAIVALLASHRAARAVGAGDVEGARRESASARRWGIASVCVGAALIVLSVLASIAWLVVAAVVVRENGGDWDWDRGPGWSDSAPFGHRDDLPGMPDDMPGQQDRGRSDSGGSDS